MSVSDSQLGRAAAGYLHKTHRPLNCLMFLLPLLAAYEAGALFYHDRLLAPRHLNQLIDQFGASAQLVPAAVIVVVLLAWHIASRQKWQIDGDAVAGMVLESILLMLPMIGLSLLTSQLLPAEKLQAAAAAAGRSLPAEVLTGIGAGIYEEFLFRLTGIGLVLLVFIGLAKAPKAPIVVAAVVATSLLFSWYHFLGADEFTWYLFAFRAAAGAYLALVYITRGFGVAVGAHACYNVLMALRG